MSLIDRWQERLARDPMPPEAFLERVRSVGALYGDRPLCQHRRPHFVPESLLRELAQALGVFHSLVRRVHAAAAAEGYAPGSALARGIGISEEAMRLAAVDPGYRSAAVVARMDCFVERGVPRFIELNAESPAGMGYADALADLFELDPIMDHFREAAAPRSGRALVRAALSTYRAFGGQVEQPRVAIVDLRGQPTAPEFELLRRRFEEAGARCVVADPRELSFSRGRLCHVGAPLDLVYRRLLVADMLEHPEACAALLQAYKAGAVCVVNPLRTTLLHGKGLFALLHDPVFQASLPGAFARVIDRHVPRTWLWGEDVDRELLKRRLDQAFANQDRLVLKPRAGHGGAGVVLGWTVSGGRWAQALAEATHHVLQARVAEQRLPFPDASDGYAWRSMMVDLAPFLIHGRLAGLLCRLSPGALANVRAGAGQVPVFAVPG